MAKSSKRPVAVFLINRTRRIGDFIIKVRGILTNMADNATIFVAPSPALPLVSGHIDDLDAAEAKAQTRAKGTAAARDLKYEVVLQDTRDLLSYVQKLADSSADEATAVAIIQASGFRTGFTLSHRWRPKTERCRALFCSAQRWAANAAATNGR